MMLNIFNYGVGKNAQVSGHAEDEQQQRANDKQKDLGVPKVVAYVNINEIMVEETVHREVIVGGNCVIMYIECMYMLRFMCSCCLNV